MNTTRAAILAILITALTAGVALYYLQVYAYYGEPTAEEAGGVVLTSATSNMPEPIPFADFSAIDSNSSPIRFRACFTTTETIDALSAAYVRYEAPVPLTAPRWFGCFDAKAIGAALEAGEATAFLGIENVTYGVDRVVAMMPDGRGYVWHQINHCGEVVFDGNPAPEGCPPVPEGVQ